MISASLKTTPHLTFLIGLLLLCCVTPACGTLIGSNNNDNIECIAEERAALLKFKDGIQEDACGLLTSWGDEQDKRDCCSWTGIQCSNRTGHVVKLDLHRFPPDQAYFENRCLTGNVGPSLFQLKHLNYLDLSCNNFKGQPIPSFIGSLIKLNHLRLSNAGFSGEIPHHLGNLSGLVYLDLNRRFDYPTNLYVDNLWWLSKLTLLKHLDLSSTNLSKASADWFHIINRLPSLTEIHMDFCGLSPRIPSSLSYINSTTSLSALSLSGNNFDSSVFEWFFNLTGINTHLVSVVLSWNHLSGPIPDKFTNLKHLSYLDLFGNNIQGSLPVNLGKLCNLRELDVGNNNLTEELTNVLETLSGCAQLKLQVLDLRDNALWGSLSGSHIFSRFPMLREIFLESNKLDGAISEEIGELSKLELLDLSGNSLQGYVSDRHFSGLSRLQDLSLGGNPELVINMSDDWIPPFQLLRLNLSSCVVGPRFPKWILTQTNLSFLEISNARISDTIPLSFWSSLSPTALYYLNMSHNSIFGPFPDTPIAFTIRLLIDLSSNSFNGTAPAFFQGYVGSLLLNDNSFQNPVPLLCQKMRGSYVRIIDLSNNKLSGELPNDCWKYMDQLVFLNMANNMLSGRIPSLDGLKGLQSLHLRNNSFHGELPSSLKHCKSLQILDLGYNSFSGYISPGLDNNFPSGLIFLSLRGNKFLGSIPRSLCQLSSLQMLDLSFNKLSGTIPKCVNNLVGMLGTLNSSQTSDMGLNIGYYYELREHPYVLRMPAPLIDFASLVWKGIEQRYMKNLRPMKMIDISSNAVEGDIPDTISSLTGLKSLNLSRNSLTGSIPKTIGQLSSLEILDLSNNHLSGHIPTTMSTLNFLDDLDLSNNSLSGKIPTGTQLQSFDPSKYMGNPELCGEPLSSKCPGDETPADSIAGETFEENNEDGDSNGFLILYINIILGFITGFWAVCGTLVLKRSWRDAYFQCLEDMKDRIYVAVVVNVRKKFRN